MFFLHSQIFFHTKQLSNLLIFGHEKSGNVFQNLTGKLLLFCIKFGHIFLFLKIKWHTRPLLFPLIVKWSIPGQKSKSISKFLNYENDYFGLK